jgi:hypothetical protein
MSIKEEIKTTLLESGMISAEECAIIIMRHGAYGYTGKQMKAIPEVMATVIGQCLRELAAEGMQLRQVGAPPRRGTEYQRFFTGYSIALK